MALTDAQWADAVALAVSRFHAGTTTESQMGDEITAATQDWPTRTLSNADLAYRISRSLANLTGLTETAGPPDPSMGTLGAMAFDKDALAFYGPKTEAGWGAARPLDAGPEGPPGPKPELQVDGGFIQWRAVGDPDWVDLIATADLVGPAGPSIELQTSATHIQWRVVGDTTWIDLVPLATLKGDAGDNGWSPVFAVVPDGERRVLQVPDWIGGAGAKPATGKYVSSTGFVDTAAEAENIRGAGGSGSGNVNGPAVSTNNAVAVWDGTTGTVLSNGPGIGVSAAGDLLRRSDGDTRYRAAGAVPQSDVTGLTAALGDKADLVGGKVPPEQLPTPPVVPSPASAAEFRAGSGSGYVTPAEGAAGVAFVAITRASAAGGLDFAGFVNASILLDANLTVSGWINNYPGATGLIRLKQDATGGRTVAWASGYIVPAGFALQGTPNGITDVPYICEADNKIRLYNPSKWTA